MAKETKAQGSRNQLTGRRGENMAEGLLLELGLQPRREAWDDGEDFSIEVPREPGGWERLFVQVKGSTRFDTTSDRDWKVRIEARAVHRYLEATHPVILLAVDVTTGEIRWHNLATLKPSARAVTVRVSTEGRLTAASRESWLGELRRLLFQRRVQLTPAPLALAAEEARLQALDPRLNVRLTADSGGITRTLTQKSPEEEVVLTFVGEPAESSRQELEELWSFGVPVTAEFKDFVVTGSPAIDHGPTDARIDLSAVPTELVVAVGWYDQAGEFRVGEEGQAVLFRGARGFEVRLHDESLPVRVTIRADAEERKIQGTFRMATAAWTGKPLAKLPWWDRVMAMLNGLANGAPLGIANREFGELVAASPLGTNAEVVTFAKNCIVALGPIPVLVEVARRIRTSATWRDGLIPRHEVERLERMRELLGGSAIRTKPRTWGCVFEGDPQDGLAVPRFHFAGTLDVELMGESIGVLEVVWRLSNYVFERQGSEANGVLLPTAAGVSHVFLRQPGVDADKLIELFEAAVADVQKGP